MTSKMGRPPVHNLNEEEIEKLAALGCSLPEMAAFFKCSQDTIERRYADAINRGRQHLKMSVRRQMYEALKKHNPIALKYFIFNVLHESLGEGPDIKVLIQNLPTLSNEQLIELYKQKLSELTNGQSGNTSTPHLEGARKTKAD